MAKKRRTRRMDSKQARKRQSNEICHVYIDLRELLGDEDARSGGTAPARLCGTLYQRACFP